MKILHETELMSNQKASTIIVPDKQFEALQTVEGNSLIFSIGTDGILFCTREVPGDTHGWVRVDLSSSLSAACYDGAAITAETFDIAQDLTSTNSVDIALVVNCKGVYYLHVVTGFANTFANWTSGAPVFGADSQYKFDYPGENIASYQAMPINDVQIVDSNDGNAMQYIIVDLVSNASTQTISRFYIDVIKQNGYAWLPHDLSSDLQAGKITTFLGCGPNDGPDSYPGAGDAAGNNIGGAYVLGSLAGKPQLQYTPAYNFNHPEETPDPTVFNFPAGTNDTYMAMDVSSSAANAPYTDLFFATNGQLYFLACADQNDSGTSKPTPVSIYKHDLFQNIQSLHVKNWNDNIVIWGQSLDPANMQTSRLFIMEGVAGHETDGAVVNGVETGANGTAWSCPIPLLSNVVNASAYVNNVHSLDSALGTSTGNAYGSCNVLFAQQVIDEVSSLTQLFQDPVTTAWQSRSLLTSPTAENIQTVIYDTPTYSTHIEITDDNNNPVTAQPVVDGNDNPIAPPLPNFAIWASSPCSVYINDANNADAYFNLDTVKPVMLTTDITGNITIMQPVDTIGGISYYVAVQDPVSKQIFTDVVNPLSGTISSLNSKIPDTNKDYLQGVQVTDEYNNSTSLVSSDHNDKTEAVSHNINTICQQNAHMDKDGLTQGQYWPNAASVAAAFSTAQSVSLNGPAKTAVKPAVKSRVSHKGFPEAKSRIKKLAKADKQAKHIRFNPATDKIWAWSYGKNAKHYEGVDAVKEIGLMVQADGSLALKQSNGQLLGGDSWIEAQAGHLFKWMCSEADKLDATLTNIIQVLSDGFVHCLLTIAGEVYHFIVKCANDIVNIVHTVLNAIETAFKDIIAWIGSLFNLADIYRTHQVVKNLIKLFINNCATDLKSIQGMISNGFGELETFIANYTDLPASSENYAQNSATATAPSGSKSPSANWGTHKLKSNGSNGSTGYSPTMPDDPSNGLLGPLITMLQNEETDFTNTVNTLHEIAKSASTTDIPTLIKQVIGAIGELITETTENILQAIIGVLEAVYGTVSDSIDHPIEIPLISWLYGKITSFMNPSHQPDPFTPLDVACLLAAIPATVVYKAVYGVAPFPENDPLTTSLTTVNDLATLKTIFTPAVTSVGAHGEGAGIKMVSSQPVVDKVGNIFATVGAVGVSICSGIKAFFPSDLPEGKKFANKVLSVLNTTFYTLYVFPDAISSALAWDFWNQTWDTNMNSASTGAAVWKALADGGSPWFEGKSSSDYGYMAPWADFVINLVWQIPTTYDFVKNLGSERGITSEDINIIAEFVGGTAFDLSGMASPLLALAQKLPSEPDPTKRNAAIGVMVFIISALNLVWGASGTYVSFNSFKKPD